MRRLSSLAAMALTLCAAGPAWAGGFFIHEQSAKGLGRAFGAEVANGDDASVLWYNPALATQFDRPISTSALFGIFISADLENRGATLSSPFTGGQPVPILGGDGGTPIDTAVAPQFAAVLPKGRWRFGFNLNSPFGLVSAYDQGYFGRYDSLRTELLTINAQVSVAYEITPALSVGVGANGQYAHAVLESAVPGVLPGAPDGFRQVVGDDLTPSFNLGVAYQPRPDLRIGASYRHSVRHELRGSLRQQGLAGPLAAANVLTQEGSADLNLPSIGMLGVSYDINDKLTVSLQGTYFHWSLVEGIAVETPVTPLTETVLDYKDTINAHAGFEYKLRPDITLRGGFMFDPTPTRDRFRTSRVPDNTRYWGTLGVTWRRDDRLSLDAALAFVSLREGVISRTDQFFEGTPLQTQADLNSSIDGNGLIAAIGGSYKF